MILYRPGALFLVRMDDFFQSIWSGGRVGYPSGGGAGPFSYSCRISKARIRLGNGLGNCEGIS